MHKLEINLNPVNEIIKVTLIIEIKFGLKFCRDMITGKKRTKPYSYIL